MVGSGGRLLELQSSSALDAEAERITIVDSQSDVSESHPGPQWRVPNIGHTVAARGGFFVLYPESL